MTQLFLFFLFLFIFFSLSKSNSAVVILSYGVWLLLRFVIVTCLENRVRVFL